MDADNLVVRGPRATIEYAVQANGRMPAKEGLRRLSERERARLYVLFERYAREGRILNPDQFKKEEGEIWSFKRDQSRVPCFLRGQRVILTHVFTKKRQRWPRREFQRAERIMNEHLTQEMGGGERKDHET